MLPGGSLRLTGRARQSFLKEVTLTQSVGDGGRVGEILKETKNRQGRDKSANCIIAS